MSDNKVIDPSSVQFGVSENVAFALAYGEHPITNNFMLRTQYLDAYEIKAKGTFENGWDVSNLIDVAPNGWISSKKDKNKQLKFDPNIDKKGPINIAVALKRKYGEKGQRVIVVGNASFLSNNFITSGGNLDLGVNMTNWLSGNDKLITIQPMPLKDINITIPEDSKSFLIAWSVFRSVKYFIPIGLLIYGFWQWYRRRKA